MWIGFFTDCCMLHFPEREARKLFEGMKLENWIDGWISLASAAPS